MDLLFFTGEEFPSSHTSSTIRQVLNLLERNNTGCIAVFDSEQNFQNILTQGDLRRCLIKGFNIDDSIEKMICDKPRAITGNEPMDPDSIESILKNKEISHLPILDAKSEKLIRVVVQGYRKIDTADIDVCIMAGGFGTRLGELTKETPKPMLNLGKKPIIQRIIEQASEAGHKNFIVTVHYLPEKIKNHLGDGKKFGVKIEYHYEKMPLGTAGALSEISLKSSHILVLNSDIIGNLPFESICNFHIMNKSDMTVAVKTHTIKNPYGVIEVQSGKITSIQEKPTWTTLINAGIYVISKNFINHLQKKYSGAMGMDKIIREGIDSNFNIKPYLLSGNWIDIGTVETLEQAKLVYSGEY